MDFSSKETLDSQYFNFSFYLPLPVMKEEDIRLTCETWGGGWGGLEKYVRSKSLKKFLLTHLSRTLYF